MVLDRTPRMHPADSGTGILALVLNTCQMLGTFRVNGTFRFTLYVGVSLQPGQAGAGGGPPMFPALGVNPAGRGSTGVYGTFGGG